MKIQPCCHFFIKAHTFWLFFLPILGETLKISKSNEQQALANAVESNQYFKIFLFRIFILWKYLVLLIWISLELYRCIIFVIGIKLTFFSMTNLQDFITAMKCFWRRLLIQFVTKNRRCNLQQKLFFDEIAEKDFCNFLFVVNIRNL